MMESGRIVHHLAHHAADPRTTILVVGFQAAHTLGRRIVERAPMIKVFGEEVPLRARVEIINGYSAHADRTELRQWLDAINAARPGLSSVYLVHGEPPVQDIFATSLRSAGYDVQCPEPGMKVTL